MLASKSLSQQKPESSMHLQGAWFIVKAYPSHCDTLAFMHGVNELQARTHSGSNDIAYE